MRHFPITARVIVLNDPHSRVEAAKKQAAFGRESVERAHSERAKVEAAAAVAAHRKSESRAGLTEVNWLRSHVIPEPNSYLLAAFGEVSTMFIMLIPYSSRLRLSTFLVNLSRSCD
jgi:hypothetical protein